jgi:hypothetical protein
MAGVLAAGAGGLALLISWYVLDLVPHVTDAVAYLFQGRILAAGHLYLPPPPVAPLFAHENIVLTATRWCAPYPPGWPLLLALGWLAHAPWLMSPLLLALAVVGVWLAGRRLYDPVTGLVAAAALACSPFALLMAGDAMAHVAALCASVWCLAMLAAAARDRPIAAGSAGWPATADERPGGPDDSGARRCELQCAAAGLLGAFALLIRPLTAVALLAPAVVWCAVVLPRRRRLAGLAWMALGTAPPLAFLAIYDTAVFGGALTLGYQVTDAHIARGTAAAVAPLATALSHTLPWYLRHLNESLWGFPWGDLLLFLALLGARRRRAIDGMLAASAAALVLVHSFYYYGDIVYSGPRLAFEALGPLALLASRSLLTLRDWLAAGLERLRRRGAGRPADIGVARPDRIGATRPDLIGAARPDLIGALRFDLIGAVRLGLTGAAVCLLLYFPLGRRLPAQVVHESQWYLAVSGVPLREAAAAGVGPRALVFVAGTPWCYSSFFPANGLHPETAPRVYVRDIPPLRADALRAYPRPETWIAWVEVTIPDPIRDPDVARPTRLTWQRLR